jgi:hypothetical protein
MAADLQYPNDINVLENMGGAIRFTIFERPDSQTSLMNRNIVLYMPQTLENPMSVSWEQTEGLATKLASQYAKGEISENGVAGALAQESKRLLRGGLGRVIGGKNETAINQSAQSIVNPYLTMTFKGIGFRTFEYMFKFTPHNERESKTIHDIISELRKAALPNNCDSGFMSFPMEIEIEYIGIASPWLNKFKRCVITDLNVNYTSAGFYAAMKNGFPAETELRIQFTENELVCRNDIDEGY